MYKLKHFFAIALALVLVTGLSTVAFAAEETGIPENATRHTIELTVEPGETINGDDAGISPYIWNQGNYNPPASGGVTYTPAFTADHRYLAYEFYALSTSGASVPGTCTVKLIHHATMTPAASTYVSINGSTEKLDWIDVFTGEKYLFQIHNSSTNSITVTLTYYTWA